MESKHLEQNLCPTTAIVLYLASKGGIPTTLRDIKNLIRDDFLLGEISEMFHNADSMLQPLDEGPTSVISLFNNKLQEEQFSSNSQANLNCQSQPQVSTNENNGKHQTFFKSKKPIKSFFFLTVGINHRNLDLLIYAASTSQPHPFNSTDTTQQPNNIQHSQITLEEEKIARMTSNEEQSSQSWMVNGNYNNSITQQQQPPPSSQQQLDTFNSIEHIMMNQNFPLTMTPSIVREKNTDMTIIRTILHTSSDKILEQAREAEYIMCEIRSLPRATTADTSIIDPAIAGTLITCSIEEKKKFIRKKDGSTDEIISWILIDDQNRRYSQQKKNVSNIFQCTANVSIQNKNKKCKGSIRIPDSDIPKLEELKKDPQKTCTFTVGNAHEEHLPSKRGRQSTDSESETSSTSGKRKKKTYRTKPETM